jgi:hypothetical protein
VRKAWTKDEEEFVITNWSTLSAAAMAKALNRSDASVRTRRAKLAKVGRVTFHERAVYPLWSDAEVAYLEANYGQIPCRHIAQHLHRPIHGVRDKVARLNLSKHGLGYSLLTLARSLGKSRNFIRDAILSGDLMASKSKVRSRYGHYPYVIREQDAIDFVRKRALSIDPTKVEDRFFLNIVNEERRKTWPKPSRPEYTAGHICVDEYDFTLENLLGALA